MFADHWNNTETKFPKSALKALNAPRVPFNTFADEIERGGGISVIRNFLVTLILSNGWICLLVKGDLVKVPKSGRFPKQEPTAHLKDLTEALTMSSGVTWTDVKRDFSTPAQATFWAGQLSMGSCPGHCRMLSSTPGLYRRLQHSLTCVKQKRLQRF